MRESLRHHIDWQLNDPQSPLHDPAHPFYRSREAAVADELRVLRLLDEFELDTLEDVQRWYKERSGRELSVSGPMNDLAARLEVWRRSPPELPKMDQPILQCVGDVWQLRYQEENGKFQDRSDSSLRHLARLLSEPHRRIQAIDFFHTPSGSSPLPYLGRDDSTDHQAAEDYEQELRKLVKEIKEAEDYGDMATAAKCRKEFDSLTEHLESEKAARKRGHKKKCGTRSPREKADQALRVGLSRLKEKLRRKGLPKLADHLDRFLDNKDGEWYYAPPPGISWHVTQNQLTN